MLRILAEHVQARQLILDDIDRYHAGAHLDSARWLLRRAVTLRNAAWVPAYRRFQSHYRQVCREELRAARVYTATYVAGMILIGLAALGGGVPSLKGIL